MPKSRPPAPPVRPRDAASLIVLRRGRRGLACLMGRRREDARFLPGCFVFPGGAVEGADRAARPASRLDLAHLGAMGVGGDAAAATALATAAVRETWEETGVMIATPGDVGAAPGATFDEMRRRGVAPALGRLVYLGRAITPARHPIRFHARFFLTLVGHGRNGLRDDARGGGGSGDGGPGSGGPGGDSFSGGSLWWPVATTSVAEAPAVTTLTAASSVTASMLAISTATASSTASPGCRWRTWHPFRPSTSPASWPGSQARSSTPSTSAPPAGRYSRRAARIA